MATVKEINHDSGPPIGNHYSGVTDPDGAITVNAASALDGSANGVNMDFDAGINTVALVETFTFTADEFRWRVRIKLDNVVNNNAGVVIFNPILESAGSVDIFEIAITAANDGTYHATVFFQQDVGGSVQLGAGNDPISAVGEICLEIRAIRETTGASADGQIEFYINGVSQRSTGVAENNAVFATIAQTRIIFLSLDADVTGNMDYDEWILDDVNTADLGCGLADLSLAAMTKPADIDAAGAFIYVALLEGGTPILTKISTALDADGTTVFDPGAGGNIGVECGRFSSDVVWVAGAFDGTNVVEKSEDGGTTFEVKDDATFTEVFAFVMGPDTDDRILINDNDTDIVETIDSGANWTVINNGAANEHNAIARLGENVQEVAFGNIGGGANSFSYSINSGANLEDYQTGVYPAETATGVIVN